MDTRFLDYPLNDEGLAQSFRIGCLFADCVIHLRNYCPESNELTLAETKLQEACLFAKQALLRDPKFMTEKDLLNNNVV